MLSITPLYLHLPRLPTHILNYVTNALLSPIHRQVYSKLPLKSSSIRGTTSFHAQIYFSCFQTETKELIAYPLSYQFQNNEYKSINDELHIILDTRHLSQFVINKTTRVSFFLYTYNHPLHKPFTILFEFHKFHVHMSQFNRTHFKSTRKRVPPNKIIKKYMNSSFLPDATNERLTSSSWMGFIW